MKRWMGAVVLVGVASGLMGCVNSAELRKYVRPTTAFTHPLAWDCSTRVTLPVGDGVTSCQRCRNQTQSAEVVTVASDTIQVEPEKSVYLCDNARVVTEGVRVSAATR